MRLLRSVLGRSISHYYLHCKFYSIRPDCSLTQKKSSSQRFSCKIYEIFRNKYLQNLYMTSSNIYNIMVRLHYISIIDFNYLHCFPATHRQEVLEKLLQNSQGNICGTFPTKKLFATDIFLIIWWNSFVLFKR